MSKPKPVPPPPNTEYLYSDHLGSTVLTTNSSGVKNTTLQYYPFGNFYQPATSQLSTDKLYTSQRKDNSSDLYFYNARYYNPQTGNFISADKAEGSNRYAYVQNNPIMKNDPSGLQIADGGGGGGKSTKSNIPLTRIDSPLPGISASGVSNNTLNIAQPGQSYCELNPGKCVADPQGFWNIMGGAVGVGLLPFALVAEPIYEVADMGLCMAISDPATCAMTAIVPGPAARTAKSGTISEFTEDTFEIMGKNGSDAKRFPGCLGGSCGFSSDIVREAPNRISKYKNFSAQAYQFRDLSAAVGLNPDLGAQHAFNIVTDSSGKRFIVDNTFAQFGLSFNKCVAI